MNVLHVDTETGFRGGQRQLLWLCQGLVDRGLRVRVAVRAGHELETACHDQGLGVVPLQQASPWDPRAATGIRRALVAGDVDIVHAHASHAHTAAAGAVRSLGPGQRGTAPVLVASRRVDFPIGRPPLNRAKYGRVVRRFLAISDAVAAVLAAGGVEQERIVVVRSAVAALAPSHRSRDEVRRELAVPRGSLLAVTTAALVDHKDHPNAVSAMAAVRSPVVLAIAGEGARRAAIEGCIERAGVGDRVKLLGQRDDVPDLLRAADLYVAASRLEGLNTALMDAGQAALPAAATNAGGIPEVVADGETGILVPVRDPAALARAIDRLAADEELRRRMGAAAARRIHRWFTVDRMVDETAAVYRELLPR